MNTGRLEVLDEGQNVYILGELAHREYFGKISVLNLRTSHRRRTTFVHSLGYSSLLCLSQTDLLKVLEDYPQTKEMLVKKGNKKLGLLTALEEESFSSEAMDDKLLNKVNSED